MVKPRTRHTIGRGAYPVSHGYAGLRADHCTPRLGGAHTESRHVWLDTVAAPAAPAAVRRQSEPTGARDSDTAGKASNEGRGKTPKLEFSAINKCDCARAQTSLKSERASRELKRLS